MKLKIISLLTLEKDNEWVKDSVSKYIASLDYFDKPLIATAIGAPVGVTSASFSFAFSLTISFLTTQNKKKKHNKIIMLARSILNSIESKIFGALTNNGISHENVRTIINEEKNYCELRDHP